MTKMSLTLTSETFALFHQSLSLICGNLAGLDLSWGSIHGIWILWLGLECNDLVGSERLDVSVGTVVPRICILQGNMWVQCVKRQGFCGRDKWNETQVYTEQGKNSGKVGWVHTR